MNILIDGMGGDHAPQEIVKGAIQAAREIEDTVTIIGAEDLIKEELNSQRWDGSNIKVLNATEVITNNEAPAMAVRKKKDSTVNRGVQMVKECEADIFISGGSTGALLAAGLLGLGRIKGIKRPAIAAFFPQIGKDDTTLLLDCGANVDCKPEFLYQFGVMGSIFVQNVKGKESPDVRLLNVGAEAEKGDELHKGAYELLANSSINFQGNIEGREVVTGVCDVVVTDGFSGNIALKTLEGAAKNLLSLLKGKEKQPIFKSFAKFILRFFFKDAYHRLKRINPDEYNGASLLGLTAVVVKSHGSANVDAFARAIADAALQARLQIPQKILAGLQRY